MSGGYFEIGIFGAKRETNVGTLWRTAYQLGASGIFVIGRRYRRQCSDTVSTDGQIPLREHDTFEDFLAQRPSGAELIAVEMGGRPLSQSTHPSRAVYILGAEDSGLPKSVVRACDRLVTVESVRMASYNVAVAGSLVMYHRFVEQVRTKSIFRLNGVE